MAAHAPVHAYELRTRSGKIEAGVKILAEEIEKARSKTVSDALRQMMLHSGHNLATPRQVNQN